MGKKDRYLVALDVGSTKTCAMIADIEDGTAKFLAMGARGIQRLAQGTDRESGRGGQLHPPRARRSRKRRRCPGGIGRSWASPAATFAA